MRESAREIYERLGELFNRKGVASDLWGDLTELYRRAAKADNLERSRTELVKIIECLWKLLDDIDTLDDASKNDDAGFRKAAYQIQRRRFETGITTDGYTLTIPTAEPEPCCETGQQIAVRDVLAERQKQYEKWGEQNHDPIVYLAILGEEFGEAQQAALHDIYGGKHAGTYREELVHTCAVALAAIEAFDRNKPCDCPGCGRKIKVAPDTQAVIQ